MLSVGLDAIGEHQMLGINVWQRWCSRKLAENYIMGFEILSRWNRFWPLGSSKRKSYKAILDSYVPF